ncbi:MAG: hypothetical protein M3Q89_00245 [Verrucomicrobiota bacterium]|nr:hypothetical protein [Verrucomicrobiota bacterium]
MKSVVASTIFALLAHTCANAKQPKATLRAHVEGNENDGAVFSTQLRSPATGKNVTIEKIPTISERDVAAFYPVPAADGSLGVLFKLSDHGKLALDTLSLEKRGTYLYIFVNGRPSAELQIDRRITDGQLFVPTGLRPADIELMKKEWRLIGQKKKKAR